MLRKLFKKKKEEDGDTVSVLTKEQKREKKIKERIEKFRCYDCGQDIYSTQVIVGKRYNDIVITPICCNKCNNSFIIKEKLGT